MRRFATALERTPGLGARIFTDTELELSGGKNLRAASLAARWAAKEAVVKVLVDNRGLEWHDCEVVNGERGEPYLLVRGTVADAALSRGIGRWHVSLSHDGNMAVAFVMGTRSTS